MLRRDPLALYLFNVILLLWCVPRGQTTLWTEHVMLPTRWISKNATTKIFHEGGMVLLHFSLAYSTATSRPM